MTSLPTTCNFSRGEEASWLVDAIHNRAAPHAEHLFSRPWRSIKTGSEIENRRRRAGERGRRRRVMLQIVTPTRVTSVSTCVLMRVRALWGILDVSPSDTPSFNVETTLFTFRPTLRLRQPTRYNRFALGYHSTRVPRVTHKVMTRTSSILETPLLPNFLFLLFLVLLLLLLRRQIAPTKDGEIVLWMECEI